MFLDHVSTLPSSEQIQSLLSELCVEHGFCLPRDVQAELMLNPPATVAEFADVVVSAEGFGSKDKVPLHLYRQVVARIRQCFEPASGRGFEEQQ